jgi:outer membrane receptor protein involved in Fe transport
LDNIPLNESSSGLFDISKLGTEDVDRVESIKGPVTAQYGDFGFGGILALQSRQIDTALTGEFSLLSASHNSWELSGRLDAASANWGVSLTPSIRRSLGWRSHSRIESQRLLARVSSHGSRNRWTGLASINLTDEQIPGALTREQFDADPAQAATDFSGAEAPDERDQADILLGGSSTLTLSEDTQLRTMVYTRYIDQDDIVSITSPLDHASRQFTLGSEVGLTAIPRLLRRELRLFSGVSADLSQLSTTYSSYPMGNETSPITDGDGERISVAGYLQSAYNLTPHVVLSLGARVDYLRTSFDHQPSQLAESLSTQDQSETAFSPKIAVSVRPNSNLSFYGSVASAFKAPTLLHLYDSPPIFYVAPDDSPGYLVISNGDLLPLKGVSYESGVRYIKGSQWYFGIDAYRFEIKEEIDFDGATFRYVNSGRSRHQGIEALAMSALSENITIRLNAAYAHAVFRNEPYRGKQLNGVPRFTYGCELDLFASRDVNVVARVDGRSEQYLDQSNLVRLGDYAITSIGLVLRLGPTRLQAGISNLFDIEHAVDGYIGLMGEDRLFPGPPRTAIVKATFNPAY